MKGKKTLWRKTRWHGHICLCCTLLPESLLTPSCPPASTQGFIFTSLQILICFIFVCEKWFNKQQKNKFQYCVKELTTWQPPSVLSIYGMIWYIIWSSLIFSFFSSLTVNRRKVLPCPAGGTPCLSNIPVFVGIYQEPPGPAQPLSWQGRAQPRRSGWSSGAQVAHSARR